MKKSSERFYTANNCKILQKSIFCGSAPSSNSMTVVRIFNAQPDNTHIGTRAPRRFSLSRRLSDKPYHRYFSSPRLYRILYSTANFHSRKIEYILFYHIYSHLSRDLCDFSFPRLTKFPKSVTIKAASKKKRLKQCLKVIFTTTCRRNL